MNAAAAKGLLSLLLLAAGAEHGEHAAENAEAAFDWLGLAFSWINFAIAIGVIVYFAGPGIRAWLKDRREGFAAQLKEAKAKQAEADQRLAEYGHKLDNLEAEVQRIVKSFEAQGEADRERLHQDADRAIERLVREVDFTIRQESLKAQQAVRAAAVDTTLGLTEKLVRDRITDADKRRLTDEYVGALDRKNGTPS
jgi:F0F1-type ATP synthase membrane subunit b/b'